MGAPPLVANAKAQQTQQISGRHRQSIQAKKQDLTNHLLLCREPEIVTPKFHFTPSFYGSETLVTIIDGAVGYGDHLIFDNLYLRICRGERWALQGKNGSGKSTLMKAIRGEAALRQSGQWICPMLEDIGYLDQQYSTLYPDITIFETIQILRPDWAPTDIRDHLNNFLFRKNDQVTLKTCYLSGGEKARLSLACIAAKTPRLLLLDEVTNNLDLETRAHVIQTLVSYPGTLMIISHDEAFLKEINIAHSFHLPEDTLTSRHSAEFMAEGYGMIGGD